MLQNYEIMDILPHKVRINLLLIYHFVTKRIYIRYLCNIGDSLLTSGICAWCLALPWCVWHICVDNASANGGAAGRRRARGWRVK